MVIGRCRFDPPRIWQPNEFSLNHVGDPTRSSSGVQVYFKLFFKVRRTICVPWQLRPFRHLEDDLTVEDIFDLRAVQTKRIFYVKIDCMLSNIGLRVEDYSSMIDEICAYGRTLRARMCKEGHKVLPMFCVIKKHVTELWTEADVMEDRMRQEEIEGNLGMVGLSETSIRMCLKRVRVEYGGDDKDAKKRCVRETANCVVCLENLEEGSVASQIQCSHIFHEKCITDWLKISSRCPICRLELPD